MEPVTFINCFEVPAGREDEFFKLWREVNRYLRGKPGYLSHQLHRSIEPGSRFRFINVVKWRSAEEFHAGHDAGYRALVAQPAWAEFPRTGALFHVIEQGHA